MRRVLAGLAAGAIALSAAPSFAQEKLTVWRGKGFYKSEVDAVHAAIQEYEAKTADTRQRANGRARARRATGLGTRWAWCATTAFRCFLAWAAPTTANGSADRARSWATPPRAARA